MTTELLDRLNRVRFSRTLTFNGVSHEFCPIWFSDWSPFGVFTWTGTDDFGNAYDLSITYTTSPVLVLSSTPALPPFTLRLEFQPPPVRIIHLSEFTNIGQEIDRPTLVVISDTSVSIESYDWIEHLVQAYYLIPLQPNLTADLKIDIHKRQLQHFRDWMNKAIIFISRVEHRPLLTEKDERRMISGDFYSISATLSFKEFIL